MRSYGSMVGKRFCLRLPMSCRYGSWGYAKSDNNAVIICIMRKIFYLCMLLVLAAVGPALAQSTPLTTKPTMSLYEYVQQYDEQKDQWQDLHAWARLERDSTGLYITLWNHWANERINPLFRIWAGSAPKYDPEQGQWYLVARMRRAKGSKVQICKVESSTVLALDPSVEFSVLTPDYTARYRISHVPFPEYEF